MKAYIRSTGFTLIELIVVLLIIGIIALIGAPKFFATSSYQQLGYFEEMAAAARYAQKIAIATRCPVQLVIDITAERYDLFFPNDVDGNPATCDTGAGFGTNPVQHPVERRNFAAAAPAGIDIIGTSTLTVVYNGFGQPSASGSVSIVSHTLTIQPDTGFVQVSP